MTIDETLDSFDDELDQISSEPDPEKFLKRLFEMHRRYQEFKNDHEDEWTPEQRERFLEQARRWLRIYGIPTTQSAP